MQPKPTMNPRVKPGVCERCGAAFMAFRSSKAQFCSKRCSALSRALPATSLLARRGYHLGTVPPHRSEYGPCWLVNGQPERDGYIRIGHRPAHAIAYEQASGEPIPEGMVVLHICDVRNCRRNDGQGVYVVGGRILPRWGHLALGTPKDNSVDAAEKGRHAEAAYRRAATKPESYARGGAHHRAVLTDEQAAEIRQRYAAGGVIKRVLAAEYRVSINTIKLLLAGKTYPPSAATIDSSLSRPA
jgi:hypothetical protein